MRRPSEQRQRCAVVGLDDRAQPRDCWRASLQQRRAECRAGAAPLPVVGDVTAMSAVVGSSGSCRRWATPTGPSLPSRGKMISKRAM